MAGCRVSRVFTSIFDLAGFPVCMGTFKGNGNFNVDFLQFGFGPTCSLSQWPRGEVRALKLGSCVFDPQRGHLVAAAGHSVFRVGITQ